MLMIGLTGSIGMGKSTISKRFSALGVPVVDADQVVHDLYVGAAVAPVDAAFPGVAVDGVIDRDRLSAALLQDQSRFKELEAIVHPLVHQAQRDLMHGHFAADQAMAVLENPLLFEMGGDARVDYTVVVSAGAQVQRERVLARDGMTAEKFETILARQVPDEEKRRRADFVVDTACPVEESYAQVDQIVEALKLRKGTVYQRLWV
ncbi:MAG: dephospho-CoA kinase [Hyphomicrobiaceae bacterium]|jgi:dephospho-CoA kinase